jgi:hypothetical protein
LSIQQVVPFAQPEREDACDRSAHSPNVPFHGIVWVNDSQLGSMPQEPVTIVTEFIADFP